MLADDVFKSTVHRAINRSGVRRYSIPLFFGTDYDVKLEVRPSLATEVEDLNIVDAFRVWHSRSQAAYPRTDH